MSAITPIKRRLIGMGLPFGLAFATDTALTLRGQSVWEAHDRLFFHALWLIHPSAVVAGYLIWGCLVVGLLVLLPEVLAGIVTIAAVFGLVGGAYSQVAPDLGSWRYQITNGLFLLTAAALGTGLWWSVRALPSVHRPNSARDRPRWLRRGLRRGLIALLAAAAGCIVLVPWHA